MTIPDDAPTGVAPTERGAAVDGTEAITAWALDDGEEWEPPRPRSWRLVAAAVAGSLAIVGAAAFVVVNHLRGSESVSSPVSVTTVITTTAIVALPEPSESPRPWAPVEVPAPRTIEPPPPPPQEAELSPEMLAALDRRFVQALRALGWAVYDPAEATRAAHEVCEQFQQHWSMNQIMAKIAAEARAQGNPNAEVVAEQFAYTALDTYPTCERR